MAVTTPPELDFVVQVSAAGGLGGAAVGLIQRRLDASVDVSVMAAIGAVLLGLAGCLVLLIDAVL
ncbi:MAG: hypothetical protein QOG26_1624 [Solirubrobacterales bacterium]|jgi:hypothetical protein|nr:hypothetical protein [Solirubrobacterales bacterium]